jgi:hypothetical protein
MILAVEDNRLEREAHSGSNVTAVIDHHEALQWTVDWGIPGSRAKSLEPVYSSCFTSSFVLFSLAGVRLFRGQSAFIGDEEFLSFTKQTLQ